MACRLSKDWLRSKDVVSIIDAFLKPLPEWPPQLLASVLVGHLTRRLVRGEPYHGRLAGLNQTQDGELVLFRSATAAGGWETMNILWSEPFCLRWEAWHGRRWPRAGLLHDGAGMSCSACVPDLTGRLEERLV